MNLKELRRKAAAVGKAVESARAKYESALDSAAKYGTPLLDEIRNQDKKED